MDNRFTEQRAEYAISTDRIDCVEFRQCSNTNTTSSRSITYKRPMAEPLERKLLGKLYLSSGRAAVKL
jgi:hypothetical protein